MKLRTSSAVKLAHAYWETLVKPGDTVIDATCGNGKDALVLARLVGPKGRLIGLDIQEEALAKTRRLLEENEVEHALLLRQSHALPPPGVNGVKLVVYNLGYLPGGDKGLTTQTYTTLESVNNYFKFLLPGGALSIACYPGHPEGACEEQALLAWAAALPPDEWNVCLHRWVNRTAAPSLLFVRKIF